MMYLCSVIIESVVCTSTLPFMAPLLLKQERITGQLKQKTEQIRKEGSILLSNFCNRYEEDLNGEYCFIPRTSLATLIVFHEN